jgi:uncharacterized protein YjdB
MKSKKILSIILASAVVSTGLFFSSANPVKADTAAPAYGVQYEAHVQSYGWGYESAPKVWQLNKTNTVEDSNVTDNYASIDESIGTVGEGKRLEAFKLSLAGTNLPAGASIQYQVQGQSYGWQAPVADGTTAGTTGQSKRIEAVAISLTGLPGYEVQYKAHVQNIGWDTNWTTGPSSLGKTGVAPSNFVGTVGKSLRLEALDIRIVKISSSTSTNTSTTSTTGTSSNNSGNTTNSTSSNTTNGNTSNSNSTNTSNTTSNNSTNNTGTSTTSSNPATPPSGETYAGSTLYNLTLTNAVNTAMGNADTLPGLFTDSSGTTASVFVGLNYDAQGIPVYPSNRLACMKSDILSSYTNNGAGLYQINGTWYKLAGLFQESTTLNSNDVDQLAAAGKTLNTQFLPSNEYDSTQTFDRVYVYYKGILNSTNSATIGFTNSVTRVVAYFAKAN